MLIELTTTAGPTIVRADQVALVMPEGEGSKVYLIDRTIDAIVKEDPATVLDKWRDALAYATEDELTDRLEAAYAGALMEFISAVGDFDEDEELQEFLDGYRENTTSDPRTLVDAVFSKLIMSVRELAAEMAEERQQGE